MRIQDPGVFAGNRRFELIRRLGAGGMGVVYEALDRERNARVALKMLPVLEADALYRFKQEFRALANLSHRNIINLYELFSIDDAWFFTMELIDGVDFLTYVRRELSLPPGHDCNPNSTIFDNNALNNRSYLGTREIGYKAARGSRPVRCNIDRLRNAAQQIAEGLVALHEGGKLHCDLKPSNILVRRDERVVILDFGLVADTRAAASENADDAWAGTIPYMSPEQSLKQPLTPASDWYSFGIVMFEALTGTLPFAGSNPFQMLTDKTRFEAPAPSRLCTGIPPDLDELCCDVLRRAPEERPQGEEILARLMPEAASTEKSFAENKSIFVGRSEHLRAMQEALGTTTSGSPVALYVRGVSGMGKTSLLSRFMKSCSDQQIGVLSGKCYELERVPYKALDGVMDSLARLLRPLPSEEVAPLLPRDVSALAQLFPVLRRVPAIDRAPRRRMDTISRLEWRQRGMAALRELLRRLAQKQPLVLAIDDLHWGDLDSADLLAELLRPPDAPAMLLILCFRAEYEYESACLQHLFKQKFSYDRRELSVGPLKAQDVQRLAEATAGRPSSMSLEEAETMARESGGNPYFVHELIRNFPSLETQDTLTLDSIIWSRTKKLPETHRRILEVLAVSGKPVALGIALNAASVPTTEMPIFNELRSLRLVRAATATDVLEIETYHDRIRETVLAHLPPPAVEKRSIELADALETAGMGQTEHLALLFDRGHDVHKAARYYMLAADEASEALAFRRAASLYDRALQLSDAVGEERRQLQAVYAESLANAGLAAEAGVQFEKAAAGADPNMALDFKRRAAYYFCTSGSVDEGKAVFREILRHAQLKLPETPRQALTSLAWRQIRIRTRGLKFTERNADSIPFTQLSRVDTAWAAAIGLAVVDTITGCSFTTASLLLALGSGEPRRIARSLCWEAATMAIMDRARAAKLLATAAGLVDQLNEPYLNALLRMARAILLMNGAQWRQSLTLFDEAEAIWSEHCRAVDWELATARTFSLWCLNYLGAFREEAVRTRLRRKEAEERGNLYMLTNIGAYPEPHVLLAENSPVEAEEVLQDSLRRWKPRGYHVQHANAAATRVNCLLYRGASTEAFDFAATQCQIMQKNGFMRVDMNRVLMLMLRMNSALAAAAENRSRSFYLRSAEEDAGRLQREHLGSAQAFASAGRAAIAELRGNADEAVNLTEPALRLFESHDMQAHAAVLRRHLGRRVGGDKGRAMVAESENLLAAENVCDIPRFSMMCFPIPE